MKTGRSDDRRDYQLRPSPPDMPNAGGVVKFNRHQLVPWGFPSGGTVALTFAIRSPDDNVVYTEAITVPWNCTAAQMKTQLLTHTAINNVSARVTTTSGPWPNSAINITFNSPLSRTEIELPIVNVAGLTGGSFPNVMAIHHWVS